MKNRWIDALLKDPAIAALAKALRPERTVAAEGACGSVGHLLAGALATQRRAPVLLVVAHLDDADEAQEDLQAFGDLSSAIFPALEIMPGESNVSLDLLAQRLALVSGLLQGDQPQAVVAPIQALMQSVPHGEAVGDLFREVRRGQALPPGELLGWLQEAGYVRVDAVEQAGDFAVRGGIVDIFLPGGDVAGGAVRLDFFGDEVDEIATIDLDSMGSNRRLESVRIVGASIDRIQSEQRLTPLWTLLKGETIVVLGEVLEIEEQARGYYERLAEPIGIVAPETVHKSLARFACVQVNQFPAPGLSDEQVRLPTRPLPDFDTTAAQAVADLCGLATGAEGEPHRVLVLCERAAEEQRLRELMGESEAGGGGAVEIERGYLHRGFVWERGGDPPLAVIPHHELFHRYRTRRRIRQVGASRAMDTFLDLEVGDHVVHAHHGVARFKALRMMKRKDSEEQEEFLTLEFADRVLLHVPATDIELVHKYVGGFSGRPTLSKLGGTRWKKQKEQAASAAKELAAELLRVQAARAAMPGIRYPVDSKWMKQFEAEFPYPETDDQLAAMVEIKKDMSDPQPMDRLICGDVGYGKTELAIRAAFKAVESGKQVAVLCPTTVLCQQHERTFRERMADYPVKIAALNRFKGAAEVAESLEGLADGSVDLVIGTHRVVSDDVRFADLGLVVVDEEQRFGVEHKNKLMRFRVTVDVLTMSATPIPRTLHFALLGLRDISSLATPPADRRSVVTEVAPAEPERIRRGILRELNREGQVFYVHNRVASIAAVALELKQLVPEARIEYAHGQMHGRDLEEVMIRFVNREIDVLVCTTIIESGIDIPTANTIFIADCDRFGLAELHQLRGRVGRYKHRAYCYLLLPLTRPLTDVASKRLRAIEDFSMLGAGFKIAMRDMEIRGVGNLLGREQSGHIATVGYEMYCHLLEQATAQLQKRSLPQPADAHLELKVGGHLPRALIPSDRHRIEAYRRISRAATPEDLAKVRQDLAEAYGRLPPTTEVLLDLSAIRLGLGRRGVESLKLDPPDLVFTTANVRGLCEHLSSANGSVRIVDAPTSSKPGTVYYRPPASYLQEPPTLLAVLRKLLTAEEPVEATVAT